MHVSFKNEDDLKNEDHLMNEDDLKNKYELKNEDDPQNGNVSQYWVIVYYQKKMLMTPHLDRHNTNAISCLN